MNKHQASKQANTQTSRQADKQTGSQVDQLTSKPANRGRHAGRQTDKHKQINNQTTRQS